jgi:hypothetical protein
MEYDVAYHLHCLVKLSSGRAILLEELRQRQTYADLIEGVPFALVNDRIVSRAVDAARDLSLGGADPFLVAPDRRDFLREPGDMDDVVTLGQRPEWLPMVRCIGVFKSPEPAMNHGMDASYLTIVWYQNEFAPPIDDPVVEKIKAIDWDRLAADVEY